MTSRRNSWADRSYASESSTAMSASNVEVVESVKTTVVIIAVKRRSLPGPLDVTSEATQRAKVVAKA